MARHKWSVRRLFFAVLAPTGPLIAKLRAGAAVWLFAFSGS